jgi:hypothetical protein
MKYLIFIPFFLQALIIFIDEFYFHIKRGLPKWEKIGHPLDTFSVLALFIFAYFAPVNELNFKIFIGSSVFSCLFVTKDEWVHKDVCPKNEMWLHALLFLHHPVVLGCLMIIWGSYSDFFSFNLGLEKSLIKNFILSQILVIGSFMTYQILYWNVLCKKKVNG